MLPLIASLGGSILSGLFAKKQQETEREWSLDDVKQQFVRLREGAELAGYNPLSVLGTASGIPAAGASTAGFMGQAIADSGLMLADNLARTQSAQNLTKVNALQMQNHDLNEQLTRATLRPNVGGVYERRAAVPSLRAALGGSDGAVSSSNGLQYGPRVSGVDARSGGLFPPIALVDSVDPRREVDVLKVPSDPGYTIVDNPYIPGGSFRVPMIAGEIPESTQYPTIVGAFIANRLAPLAPWAKSQVEVVNAWSRARQAEIRLSDRRDSMADSFRATSSLGWAKMGYMGPGARNQNF